MKLEDSSKEEPISSTELPPEKNSGRGQNEVSSPAAMLETEVDQDVCSDEVASSTALHHLEIESSSPATGDHSEGDENGKCLEQDDGRNKNEYAYCKGKQPRNVTFSEEVASSTELNHLMSEEPSPAVGARIEGGENGKCLEQRQLLSIVKEMKMENAWNKTIAMGGSLEVKTLPRKLLHQRSFIFLRLRSHHRLLELIVKYMKLGIVQKKTMKGFKMNMDIWMGKQYGGENFTEKVASSNKLNDLGIEESPLVARAHSKVDEIRNCLEQDNASNRISSPPVAGAPSEIHESRTCSEEDNQRYQHEHGSCNENQSVGENFTKEDPSSIETNHLKSKDSSPVAGAHSNLLHQPALNHLESEESPPVAGAHSEVHDDVTTCFEKNNGRKQSEFEDHERECPGNTKFSDEVPSSTELTGPEIEESFPEVDENIKSSIFGSSRVENLLAARPKDSIITAQGPLGESILTETCTSLHSDQLEQPQKRSNHAYDGSVSSYNGTDDQVPDQYRHLWKRKWKAAESSSTKAIPRRNEVTNTIIEKKQYYMRGSKWHQDEFLGPTRCPSIQGLAMRKAVLQIMSGNRFVRLPSPRTPERGNLELLKMVFELQDQINRTRMSKGNGNGRFPGTDKHIPSYYDRVAPEVEICPNLIHTTCRRRCNQGKIRPHQSRTSRIPFSSQVDHFCVHCIPQDWHSSAPLPPYIFYNESQYTAHPCQRHYNLHRYSPSSPQHHTSSEFSSQSCGENSGDRWHKDREVKKYPRERNYLKKHVRPLAIGAPFLVCYHCSEVLKLPEDFLLFRRKCQKLKCSACSVILKFSLQNRTHVVPYTDYTPDATAPPTQEREKRRLIFKDAQNIHKNPVETNVSAGVSSKMSKAVKLPSEIEELPSPLHMLKGYTSPTEVMHK
ncbi:hypothetical protein Acr_03g0003090 [Actinidia rufa]|uniref:Probable zinc-ribbon domain-containing protein n=1 Tax=Actinidia rufa TaxID=165716 RepID=A0A7J0EAW4_9ERIC|nr:hypothetical protein Acr_03g0003090 [Actinidia rufa]